MAGSIGSARQEAERLVASVLAMAGESDDLSRTRQRLTEGIGALGETLAGMVGQFTGESPGHRPEAGGGERPATEKSSDQARGQAHGDEEYGRREAGDRENGGQWIGGWGWAARGLSGWTGARGSSHGPAGWSTGSAECCVCPVCRAIAAVRDPSPETAVRLAAGAGDLATGVARAMRVFSALGGTRPAQRTKPARPTRHVHDPDIAWSAATRSAGEGGRHEAPVEDLDPETSDPWTAATRTASTAGRHEAPAPPPQPARQAGPTRKPAPPAPGADPWAAATAAFATQGPAGATAAEPGPDATAAGAAGSRTQKDARGDADVAGTPGVAHDVPGPVDAGPAEGGSAPAASAAGERAAGTDDEAGTREAG